VDTIRYSGMLLAFSFLLPAWGEPVAPAALAPDSPARLENLRNFVSHAQYAEAYKLGTELAPYFEGDPQFDFNFGLACLESGQYDNALFIFERLTILFPNEPRYRLELARAQFFLRNLVRAEKEFKRVLRGNPPDAVKANIQRFLDEIKTLQRSVEPAFVITLDAGGGDISI
jgi:tetratricopeptide (TPR) repeat protein